MKKISILFFVFFSAIAIKAQTNLKPVDTMRLHVLNWEEHEKLTFTDSISEFICLKTFTIEDIVVQIFFEKEVGVTALDLEKSGSQGTLPSKTRIFYYNYANDSLAQRSNLVIYNPDATIKAKNIEVIPVIQVSIEQVLLYEQSVLVMISDLYKSSILLGQQIIYALQE